MGIGHHSQIAILCRRVEAGGELSQERGVALSGNRCPRLAVRRTQGHRQRPGSARKRIHQFAVRCIVQARCRIWSRQISTARRRNGSTASAASSVVARSDGRVPVGVIAWMVPSWRSHQSGGRTAITMAPPGAPAGRSERPADDAYRLDRFWNRVVVASKRNGTVPTGPLRCFATTISAMPVRTVSFSA